jgi:hypothetical protein
MRNKMKKHIDSSGKMFREKYLINNYNEIYKEIKTFNIKYKLDKLPFKEQAYHYLYNIKNIVKCKNPNCDNIVKFKNSTIGYYDYCCNTCIGTDPKIIKIKENKSLKKFGTKTPAESEIIKNKIKMTNIKKYNNVCPLQNKNIQEKSKSTLMKNYGVNFPLQNDEIKKKTKKTCLQKYGVENVKQSKQIQEKIKKTMFERYGVEYALQNKEIKKQAQIKQKNTITNNLLKYYPEYKILKIDLENKEYTMMCDKGHEFKINYVLLNSRRKTNTLICTICNPINIAVSGLEIQLSNFIKENYKGKIIENSRKIISSLELDIYLPDLNLAFEFNGLYWHSELYKPNNYHLNKTEKCLEKGIQLIHIWEDDWRYKQKIVKSMILNKLGKIPNKIFARKTEIKEITDNKLIREFLDNNHLQGFVGSSIKLGLFFNNELVSLMTFGKNRLGIGKINKYDFELLRFCNKLNTNVIGGASKLFKYFIKNYNSNKIVSYADRSYSQGKLYEILNFNLDHITKYSYSYIVNKIRKHRFNYRKSKLNQKGTEHEIMQNNDIYRIYNSGHYCFIWQRLK